MWAFGRYDLALSEEGFLDLTLRELSALSDRFKDAQKWLDYRAALICTVTVNSNPHRTVNATPEDFMPGIQKAPQTPEQMLAAVKLLNSAFGGNVIEE